MKWLLRPSTLMVLFALLVAAAAFWAYESTSVPRRPAPLAVPAGDREIAWLNAATSASWQRFVQAVRKVEPGVEPGPETFPLLTTAVPEIVIPLRGKSGRLRIRWYKTTSEWNTDYWVKALVTRDPPPLAIIGGNTTDVAIDQAQQLRRAASVRDERQRPLLLLTTATADRVAPSLNREGNSASVDGVPLIDLYPERTFRFCFSNGQMGAAVTNFIWSRDELRPDAFPFYPVTWRDDPYSGDLIEGFIRGKQGHDPAPGLDARLIHRRAAVTASDVGTLAGFSVAGGMPLSGLTVENSLPLEALLPRPSYIPWSVGSFDRPNRHEAWAALDLFDDLERQPWQQRPLLVLAGQSQPSRRFVRALTRLSPMRARRFVVVTGDAIPFNMICRDRDTTWPIQDLPCSLVFFCHHNPIDDPAFLQGDTTVSGTEDLLLYQDIVAALVETNSSSEGLCADAEELRQRLKRLKLDAGRPVLHGEGATLFDVEGNRSRGTGEHIVWLQPHFDGERVLPEATIRVHAWRPGKEAWAQRGRRLHILYTGARQEWEAGPNGRHKPPGP